MLIPHGLVFKVCAACPQTLPPLCGSAIGRACAILRHGELGKRAFTAKCALATTRNSGNWHIGAKIICDTLALLLGFGVQKPHQHKERHHRGHKIRIGHFPRAAVMTIPANNLFRLMIMGRFFRSSAIGGIHTPKDKASRAYSVMRETLGSGKRLLHFPQSRG